MLINLNWILKWNVRHDEHESIVAIEKNIERNLAKMKVKNENQ